jgi:hypothetical protein
MGLQELSELDKAVMAIVNGIDVSSWWNNKPRSWEDPENPFRTRRVYCSLRLPDGSFWRLYQYRHTFPDDPKYYYYFMLNHSRSDRYLKFKEISYYSGWWEHNRKDDPWFHEVTAWMDSWPY